MTWDLEALDELIDGMRFAGNDREKQVFEFGAYSLRDAILAAQKRSLEV